MKSRTLKITVRIVALIFVTYTIGCQQRCQASAPQAFTSLSEATWRMIDTTDPQITNLDRFNFRIMQFNRNFSGVVNLVQDNDQFDTPLMSFIWSPVSTGSKTIRLKYSDVTGADAGGGQQNQTNNQLGTFDYSYRLTNELEMTETQRGYYYRFVPFVGVVDPDSKCTYK